VAIFGQGGYVDQAQQAAQKGVEGFGQVAQRPLTRQIGTMLGGLNSIGALRSGAVPVAAQDIAETYGNQVGGYAKMAAGESLGAGLAANEQDLLRQQLDQQRKSSLLGAIGQGLGFAANKIFPAKTILQTQGTS
jgi:hypothetical protein